MHRFKERVNLLHIKNPSVQASLKILSQEHGIDFFSF